MKKDLASRQDRDSLSRGGVMSIERLKSFMRDFDLGDEARFRLDEIVEMLEEEIQLDTAIRPSGAVFTLRTAP